MSDNSDNTPTVSPSTDDLDAFNDLLNGKANPTEEAVEDEAPSEEEVQEEPQLDTDPVADEQEDEDEGEDEEEEATPAPEPKKKSRAQERIEDLNAKYRESERNRKALEDRLAALEAGLPKPEDNTTKPTEAPDPFAKDEDGSPKYALGEIDPDYIRDFTRWTVRTEQEAIQREQAEQAAKINKEREITALAESWNTKLEEVATEVPDIRVKGEEVGEMLAAFEPAYGEFIATTLMQLDNGPQVVAYLADNMEEARKIVASGPVSATIGLGRLDALFIKEAKPKIKPSKAPEPPKTSTRGTDGRFSIPADTDNLEDFERLFYKKK